MKTKKTLICLFVFLTSIGANATTINGICYTLNSTDKTATVTYYSTNSTSNSNFYKETIQIPSSVTYGSKSYSVIAIEANAFRGCVNITSITIPNSITTIGNSAFSGCSGMTSISIPTSVTSIGAGAFSSCSGLSSISLPSSVTSIGESIFYCCTGLTSVTMTSRVTSIPNSMFEGCTNLRNFYIPSTVTTIEPEAFLGCTQLSSISIPTSVTTIQSFAFARCSNLTSITLPPSIVEIQGGAFNYCTYLSTINIPANVRTIGSHPISYSQSGDYYYEYSMDDSYYSYSSPFGACSSLKTIVVDEDNPYYSSIDGVLYNKGEDILYDFPSGKTGIYTVPSQTKAMNYGILLGCDKLTGLYLSDSFWVPKHNQFPFSGSQIKTLHIGKKLSGSFQTGGAATQLPNVETITVDEANTTWWVEDGVLYGVSCEWDYWGDYLVPYYSSLVLYPKKKTNSSFSVPEGVKSIAPRAMGANSYLKTISLPSTLGSIRSNAFENCSNLQTVNNLPSWIDDCAFSGCSKLSSINLSPRVTGLGDCAFKNCTSLKTIVLGEALEYDEIWDEIFYGCNSIEHIYVLSNNLISYGYDDIGEDYVDWIITSMFNNYNATVHVPYAYLSNYRSSSQWSRFNIVSFVENDVNGDGGIDVVDVVDIARYVVGTPAETFVPILADINNSGEVNIADAVCLVNMIAGDQNFVKAMRAPRRIEEGEETLALNGDNNGLSLALENRRSYTAFQFDLYVPDDVDVTSMLLNAQRKQKHQLLYNKVEEGHWRVAAISTSNRSFDGNDGELLTIHLDGIADDGVCIRNIHFFTADGGDYMFDDLMMQSGIVTDINSLSTTSPMEGEQSVFDLQGRKITNRQLPKGVYIVNGKKVSVK